jgi:hypothetical protein
VGWISGRSSLARWAYGAFALALWDLFYYVFLKLVLDWPDSLMTKDVLFLIPVPWVAPVLAPVIVSSALIGGSCGVLWREAQGNPVMVRPPRWVFLCLGGLVVVASFLLDTGAALHHQLPGPFSWSLFAAVMLLGVFSFVSGLGGRSSG